jgi:putative phosphoribosyl transferase
VIELNEEACAKVNLRCKMKRRFRDRTEAGRLLAEKLKGYADRPDVIVLALPRGGVPVASEVARALEAPLDVLIVRKLGMPGQPELAMGAIASGGICVLNEDVTVLPHPDGKDRGGRGAGAARAGAARARLPR